MFLYLIQHGEAVSKDLDPERPLSSKGVDDVKKVASYAAVNCGIESSALVYHSGKLRARQTAEIVASTLGLAEPEQVKGRNPMDEPADWQEKLATISRDLILVGHLPYMGRLSSLLLAGDAEKNIVQFKMGGIVALKMEDKGWSLHWQVIPEIILGN